MKKMRIFGVLLVLMMVAATANVFAATTYVNYSDTLCLALRT